MQVRVTVFDDNDDFHALIIVDNIQEAQQIQRIYEYRGFHAYLSRNRKNNK